jgi:hypothetical protein
MADPSAETLIPVYGFLEGDTLGVVVLMYGRDKVASLAERVALAARVRVRPRAPLEVRLGGEVLSPEATLVTTALRPLDRVDVRELRP